MEAQPEGRENCNLKLHAYRLGSAHVPSCLLSLLISSISFFRGDVLPLGIYQAA